MGTNISAVARHLRRYRFRYARSTKQLDIVVDALAE
jgi:hypothetical protein